MYNSKVGSHQDDSDITIINPSIIDENNDDDVDNTYVPIITRLKQANNSSENRQIANTQTNNNVTHSSVDLDYIWIHHNPLKNAQDIEQVITSYIRDLKQESKTQLLCDKQLVIRLMDLIRPAYSNDQQKLMQLDRIIEEIGLLHDKRHVEQNEKIEKLHTEIDRLNAMMLFTANNHHSMYNDNTKSISMFSTIHQEQAMNNHDQWTEIEDDAKKLHEIVQTQQHQINEIVTLISQTATASTSMHPTNVPTNNTEVATTDKQPTPTPTPTSNINIISSLLRKIQDITGKHEPVTTAPSSATIAPSSDITAPSSDTTAPSSDTAAPLSNATLINHSPGISPTQSMATITSETFAPTIDDRRIEIEDQGTKQTEQRDEQIVDQVPIVEQPHAPIDISVLPDSPIEAKKCPVCNYKFASTSDDVEMYDHIDKCLFPTGIYTEPKDYECPNCNRKFPGNNERAYHEHLSDCFNREN